MRSPYTPLKGLTVELMSNGMEFPICGRINKITNMVRIKSDPVWCYELETEDGRIYLINIEDVIWVSTKKTGTQLKEVKTKVRNNIWLLPVKK